VGWFDDIVEFVGDVADVVSDPIGTLTEVISDPVGAITDAVNSVSNVVEGVAPLGGVIGTVLGGPIGGAIGNAAGGILGGGNGDGDGGPFGFVSNIIDTVSDIVPDGLMDVATDLIGGGSLIGAAGDLLGGGLGDVASGLLGTIGEVAPGLSDVGGFLGGLDGIAGSLLKEGVVDPLVSGVGIPTDILDNVSETFGDIVGAAGGVADQVQDVLGPDGDSPLGFLDDLLPDAAAGALGDPGKLLEGLGQIAQTGGLGEALASLSTDDLSALVTKLVTPVSPAAAAAADAMTTSPGIIDPANLPGADDDFTFDGMPTNTGIVPPNLLGDDDLLGTGAAAAADDGSMVTMDSGDLAATSGPADMDASGGFSDDVFSTDMPMDAPAPDVAAISAPAPEPEQTDFSQAIQSADAVDQSFDSMFEDLG
jgi:hypothetical protein